MKLSLVRVTSERQLAEVHAIRYRVFVQEQGVPVELERDELDSEALHYLASLDGQAVATGRLRRTPQGVKFERFAVLGAHRGKRVGAALARTMLAELESHETAYMHAQKTAVAFWLQVGFEPEGGVFQVAGIAHQKLVRVPEPETCA